MTEPALQLLVLVRFLCFVAVVYLGLHIIFSRLISRPDSKILWFFSYSPCRSPGLCGGGLSRAQPNPGCDLLRSFSISCFGWSSWSQQRLSQVRCIERHADISRRQYSGYHSLPRSPEEFACQCLTSLSPRTISACP